VSHNPHILGKKHISPDRQPAQTEKQLQKDAEDKDEELVDGERKAVFAPYLPSHPHLAVLGEMHPDPVVESKFLMFKNRQLFQTLAAQTNNLSFLFMKKSSHLYFLQILLT